MIKYKNNTYRYSSITLSLPSEKYSEHGQSHAPYKIEKNAYKKKCSLLLEAKMEKDRDPNLNFV